MIAAQKAEPRLFNVATEAALLLLSRLPGELTGSGGRSRPTRTGARDSPQGLGSPAPHRTARAAGLDSAVVIATVGLRRRENGHLDREQYVTLS